MQCITSSPTNSFVKSSVTETQVSTLFKALDTNKSSTDIPNKLIKLAADPLSEPFTQIFNQSIVTVPNVLKSRMSLQFTKIVTSLTQVLNYRSISILSPFSKVLERLIYNQLYDFLEKLCILFHYQFGFRKGYSTEQAILEITDTLRKTLDKKLVTCGLQTFQRHLTLNHDILLSKLYHYGIRGTPLDWFKNYLYDRTQFVN